VQIKPQLVWVKLKTKLGRERVVGKAKGARNRRKENNEKRRPSDL